jgi:hypothetical protein
MLMLIGHPSVYGNVHVHINAGKVEFEGRDGVMASLKSDNSVSPVPHLVSKSYLMLEQLSCMAAE